MPESKKFRLPIIELLSIAIVVVASVIVLYPGADKYVVSMVKGTSPVDEVVDHPNPEFTTAATTNADNEVATQTLEQRIQNNSFEAPELASVPVRSTPILPVDEQVLEFTEVVQPTEDHLVSTAATPLAPLTPMTPLDPPDETSFDNEFVDGQFEVETAIENLPEEEPFIDNDSVVLTAPLVDDNVIPEAEFTTEFEAAPSSIPTSQISLELPSNYDVDEDLIPVESEEDESPEIRQLPIWEPESMRVIEGSLTPAVSRLNKKLPKTTNATKNEHADDESVAWRSTVVKNKLFHQNDLKPTVKQVAAPKIQTARLPDIHSVRAMPSVPQPFANGFIPEHVPGEKSRMMSRVMQENNDFALPALSGPATPETPSTAAAPARQSAGQTSNPLR